MGRLHKIEEQIKGLEEIRTTLAALIKSCEENRDSGRCSIMDVLNRSD